MGITGLLQFVEKAKREVNIRSFSGSVVAVDAYCWLHKGAFSCAEKLARGETTDGHIRFCMKLVNMLLSAGVKPILVFDGKNLPSKKLTEEKRRARREGNRKEAARFLREGRKSEAEKCFQKCIDITPEMALELIQACRKLDVDCIVAPYEADAQLAYLNKCGIADIVITEDSDLLLFGCERIVFKLSPINGQGVMVEQSQIYKCMGLNASNFVFDKFRNMCILSGCDYLPSLPGIGLVRACKVFSRVSNPDPQVVLSKLPGILNMPRLEVTSEYKESFIKALNTFLYQLVFCPLKKKLVPLNPYPPEIDPKEITYAGEYFSDELAYQMALGNVHLHTMKQVDNFDPNAPKTTQSSNGCRNSNEKPQFKSIWDKHYCVIKRNFGPKAKLSPVKSTCGKEVIVDVKKILKQHSPLKKKRHLTSGMPAFQNDEDEKAMFNSYLAESPSTKKIKVSLESNGDDDRCSEEECDEENASYVVENGGNDKSMEEKANEECLMSCVPETPPTKKAVKEVITSSSSKDVPIEITRSSSPPKPRNIFRVNKSAEKACVVKSRFFTPTPAPPTGKRSTSWLDEIDAQYDVKQTQQANNDSSYQFSSKDWEQTLSKVDFQSQETPKVSYVPVKKIVQADLGNYVRDMCLFKWARSAAEMLNLPHLNLIHSPATRQAFDLTPPLSQEDKAPGTSSANSCDASNNEDGVGTSETTTLCKNDELGDSLETNVGGLHDNLSSSLEQSAVTEKQVSAKDDEISIVNCFTNTVKAEKTAVTQLQCLEMKKPISQVKIGKCRSIGLSKRSRRTTLPTRSDSISSSNQQNLKDMLEKFKFVK